MKKIKSVLFGLLFVLFLQLNINLKADEAKIEIIESAQIRFKTEKSAQGLRFSSDLDVSLKDEEHGFYVMYGYATTNDLINALDNDNNINGKQIFKVTVPSVNNEGSFSVVLTGIPEEAYLDIVSVVSYVVVDNITYYSEHFYRSVGMVALGLEKEGFNNPSIDEIIDNLNLNDISLIRSLNNDEEVNLLGVITSKALYDYFIISNDTGSIKVKIDGFNSTNLYLDVGDEILIKGKKKQDDTLYILNDGLYSPNVLSLQNSINIINKNEKDLDSLTPLTNIKIDNLQVVLVENTNERINITLKNSEEEIISFYYDKRFNLDLSLLNSIEIDDYVSFNGALVTDDLKLMIDDLNEISVIKPPKHGKEYTEDFNNVTLTGSSYVSGSHIGVNGILWSYDYYRADQPLDGTALTTKTGNLTATLNNGVSYLAFDHVKAFQNSSDRSFEIYINGSLIDVVTVDPNSTTPNRYVNDNLSYSGQVVLKIVGKGEQKTIDNITIKESSGIVEFTTVTFLNDDNSLYETITIFKGTKVNRPANPIKVGYAFIGWELNGVLFNFDNIVLNEITLTPLFLDTSTLYLVEYMLDGTRVYNEHKLVGSLLVKPNIIPEEGYKISAWYKDEALTIKWNFNSDKVTSNLVLYAIEQEDIEDEYLPYYDGITEASDVKVFLNNLLNSIGSNYATTYDEAKIYLPYTDQDPDNPNKVLLIYNRASVKGPYDYPIWNREHVWAKSKLAGGVGTGRGIGSDLHNLRVCDVNINSSRGNLPFAEGSGSYGKVSGGFYPGDEDKGDVARIIFYMNTRWGNSKANISQMGSINMFLRWHFEDPVDDFERNRNELIYQYQGNRNPYIDHPNLATLVYGEVVLFNEGIIDVVMVVAVIDLPSLKYENEFLN